MRWTGDEAYQELCTVTDAFYAYQRAKRRQELIVEFSDAEACWLYFQRYLKLQGEYDDDMRQPSAEPDSLQRERSSQGHRSPSLG